MRLLGALGGLDEAEMRATFNGGIGMVVVVAPEAVDATIASFEAGGTVRNGDRRGRSRGAARRLPVRRGGCCMSGRIAVAVSGAGSNLRALHAAAERGELGGEIVLVVADRPCPAIEWAA